MEDIEKQEQLPDDSDDNMDNTEEDEEEESPEMVEDQSPNGKGQENLELPATEKRLKEDHPMSDGDDDDDDEAKTTVVDAVVNSGNNTCALNNPQDATPLPLQMSSIMDAKSNAGSGEKNSNAVLVEADEESEDARAAFMRELEQFFRQRSLDFKPPKFYQEPLNLLKLWKAVIKLGGYETVTGSKLWRQVGDSFHPPKTCTTVSWTFRIFYEKALLEFEKHKRQIGELEPLAAAPEPASVENEEVGYQAPGSGRARRDAAARAMQGWHAQRLLGYGEAVEPVVKDKSFTPTPKREKNLKSLGIFKHKKTTNQELVLKDALPDATKQLNATVVDFGPPADWVKVNVRETKDCFEVYALVPGLLREEVRVQSDPAGRLVITGEPEQPDNPWGITPFKKVVNLPARIDPLQTSAVVSLHGRLFVRVPFEQSNF